MKLAPGDRLLYLYCTLHARSVNSHFIIGENGQYSNMGKKNNFLETFVHLNLYPKDRTSLDLGPIS